jgi:hypothetical protein
VVIYVAVFLLSASTLAFEITLARLFSISQFYHFAFMTVSLALLGGGASGALLAVFPRLRRGDPARRLATFALGASLATMGSFLLANWLPFDSFAIAWDRRQAAYLALMYLALSTPFLFGGLAVGWLLAARPDDAPRVYAASLMGSAAGCLLALGALERVGGEGAVIFGAGLACLASLAASLCSQLWARSAASFLTLVLLAVCLIWKPTFLDIRLSPYKALSDALRYPGAQHVWTRWDASSRVDLIRSPGIHSFPGLSFAYLGPLPSQDGLTFDGDDLSPITFAASQGAGFADFMPGALAFRLRPGARTLVLEARGGLDAVVALANGASSVTVVEPSEIAIKAVSQATQLEADPRVRIVVQDGRGFARRTRQVFDVVQLSLTSPYRPVTSGAYSLMEDYSLTVEAFDDDVARLNDGGLFVVTRWLQSPPTEPLRLFALAVTAAEHAQLDPRQCLAALRSYNTITLILKRGSFTGTELGIVREFAAARKLDLVALPGLRADEANRFNLLRDDVFFRTFGELLAATDRDYFYAAYPFDVTPPTDDRPFFGHYFKWAQAREVWAQLGKTWQPFGGAGYFVLVVLLAFAVTAASVLIVLPLVVQRAKSERRGKSSLFAPRSFFALTYFALLGCGFLFIEIPLVQRFILFMGKPVYALAVVLFSLLSFSGLGSALSRRAPWRVALAALTLWGLACPFLMPALLRATLGWSLAARFMVGVAALAPLGILMGIPFPKGIAWLERAAPDLIPWAWGVNGAVSVVASVLAALVALSAGFRIVLIAGALCYGAAMLVVASSRKAGATEPCEG